MGDSSFKTGNIQDRSGPPFCVRKQICSTTNMAKSNWHRRQLERGTSRQTWDNLQMKKNNDYNWIEDIQHIRTMNWLGYRILLNNSNSDCHTSFILHYNETAFSGSPLKYFSLFLICYDNLILKIRNRFGDFIKDFLINFYKFTNEYNLKKYFTNKFIKLIHLLLLQ